MTKYTIKVFTITNINKTPIQIYSNSSLHIGISTYRIWNIASMQANSTGLYTYSNANQTHIKYIGRAMMRTHKRKHP